MTHLIPKIKQLREAQGLSQVQLADHLKVSVDTIANWENGRRGVETLERFVRLCEVLHCSPQDLIGYSQSDESKDPSDSNHDDILKHRVKDLNNRLLDRSQKSSGKKQSI